LFVDLEDGVKDGKTREKHEPYQIDPGKPARLLGDYHKCRGYRGWKAEAR